MVEREPQKEVIGKGELFFLEHPGTEIFSGYGLTIQPDKEFLVGLLMVDRPQPADPAWLKEVEATFGSYQLVAMTETGEKGIVCQMQIEPESQHHLRQYSSDRAIAIQKALEPLMEALPIPTFFLSWNDEKREWQSRLIDPLALPQDIHDLFERTGYGCLPSETNIGIVHVCHAADNDIVNFVDKPVWSQWQLIQMPRAPLLRLALAVKDRPDSHYQFEHFINIGDEDQVEILDQLTMQDELYLSFYGNDLRHRFTKVIEHDETQRQQLRRLIFVAHRYWEELPPDERDFDQAKAEFMSRFV